jgi:hypothetical protein
VRDKTLSRFHLKIRKDEELISDREGALPATVPINET